MGFPFAFPLGFKGCPQITVWESYIQTDVASDTSVNFLSILFCRPPERRHGYEQQFHTVTAQPEHEALEAKRPRMDTVAETHITRTPPTAGGIVLPMPHTLQDSLRATVEVKKVGPQLFSFELLSLQRPSELVK